MLNIEGGVLLGPETYPANASLSDLEVNMNVCDIMQAITCHIFLPLFPYCFLHIVISIFSSAQAWGIVADDSWTGHPWQRIYPVSVGWVLLTEIAGSTSVCSSKVSGLAQIYLRNGTYCSYPHSHLMKSLSACQSISWLTSPTRVDRFREALNSTGKWSDFFFLSSLFVSVKKTSKNGL